MNLTFSKQIMQLLYLQIPKSGNWSPRVFVP